MNATNKALLALLVYAVANCDSAYAHPVIVVDPRLPKSGRSILDLRIEKIELSGITMRAALEKIRDAVYDSSGGKLAFSYGYRYARAAEFAQKGIPAEKWEVRDPPVKLRLGNTTLREVLNELCAQSGWSYASFGDGIGFIDDDRYNEAQRAVMRGDQSTARKIVAALDMYRKERGTYPDRLADLTPKYMSAVKPPRYGEKKWEYVHYPKRDSFALYLRGRKHSQETYWYNPLRQEFLPATQRSRN
jgi:hypothetical protein